MLDASVVFLIVISALVTIIWIKGNIGDKLGRIVIDQNKEKSDLGSMEKEVSNIAQHVGDEFRKGGENTDEEEKNKDEDDSESKSKKNSEGKKKKGANRKKKNSERDGSKGKKKKGANRKKKNSGK